MYFTRHREYFEKLEMVKTVKYSIIGDINNNINAILALTKS